MPAGTIPFTFGLKSKRNTMKIVPFTTLLLATLLASCGPTLRPFTEDLQASQKWSERELKKVQFYLSDNIVLRRQLSKGETAIEGGKILMEEGRRIEEVVFAKDTPGVLMFMPKSNRMAVSFENGSDRFLMFGPNPNVNDRYVLLASDWSRARGKVNYSGKEYSTSSSSAFAGLMVDLSKIERVTVNRRKAKGRTI